MVCSNCGKQNSEEAKFCFSCGNPLNKIENSVSDNNVSNITNGETNNNQTNYNQAPLANSQNINQNEVVQNEPLIGNNNNINSLQSNSNNINNKSKKVNKKLIIIVSFIFIFIITIIILIIILTSSNKNGLSKGEISSLEDLYNPKALIPVKVNNKYGYIDSNGKMVIKPSYDDVSIFHGNYAIVSDKDEDFIIDKKGAKANSDILKYSRFMLNYLDKYETYVTDNAIYDKNLKPIIKNKNLKINDEYYAHDNYFFYEIKDDRYDTIESGIMLGNGKKTFTVKGSSYIDALSNEYAIVNYKSGNKEKYVIVNCNSGKKIYATNKEIDAKKNTLLSVNGEFIFVDDDKIVFKYKTKDYDIDYDDDSAGYISIKNKKTGKTSYYDILEKKVTKDNDRSFSDVDRYYFSKKYNYNITKCKNDNETIKKGNKDLLGCKWKEIKLLDSTIDSYLRTKKREYVIGINDEGTYLLDLKSGKSINKLSDDDSDLDIYIDDNIFVYVIVNVEGKKYLSKKVYNMISNKEIVFDSNEVDNIHTYGSYFVTEKDGVLDYYNFDMKKIYSVNES